MKRLIQAAAALNQEVTHMVKASAGSVRPDSVSVEFDDERLIANAGLLLIATLSRRLGIEQLVDKTVKLGERARASRPGRRVLTLIRAIAAGADSIDDAVDHPESHGDCVKAGMAQPGPWCPLVPLPTKGQARAAVLGGSPPSVQNPGVTRAF